MYVRVYQAKHTAQVHGATFGSYCLTFQCVPSFYLIFGYMISHITADRGRECWDALGCSVFTA